MEKAGRPEGTQGRRWTPSYLTWKHLAGILTPRHALYSADAMMVRILIALFYGMVAGALIGYVLGRCY